MKKKLYLGIDPGTNSGAISYIHKNGLEYESFNLKSMTPFELSEMIAFCGDDVIRAFLEDVKPHPNDGKKAHACLMGSFRELRMALYVAKIPFELISPIKWKTKMKCKGKFNMTHTEKKKITRMRAQELFPNIKITNDNADSLLIAEYGRLKNLD